MINALLYIVDLFINELKTKFNNIFLQNDFKYQKNSQLVFQEISSQELNKCFQEFFFCRQEKATTAAVPSFARQNCNHWQQLKMIIFVLNYLTVLVYTKTIIFTSVSVAIYFAASRPRLFITRQNLFHCFIYLF